MIYHDTWGELLNRSRWKYGAIFYSLQESICEKGVVPETENMLHNFTNWDTLINHVNKKDAK